MSSFAGPAQRVASPPFHRPPHVAHKFGTADGAGLRIGVVDSGWDSSLFHPLVLPGIAFAAREDDCAVGLSADYGDRIGHGTACADLILRIAPAAEIIPIRVFGARLETSPAVLESAVRWAVEQRLDVVNLSLGTRLVDVGPLYAACEKARRDGVIIVAAESGRAGPGYPALFDNVIGVGAGSCRTPWEIEVRPQDAIECLALARHPDLLCLGGRRAAGIGTSFAAPIVSGVLALFLEHDRRSDKGRVLSGLREWQLLQLRDREA